MAYISNLVHYSFVPKKALWIYSAYMLFQFFQHQFYPSEVALFMPLSEKITINISRTGMYFAELFLLLEKMAFKLL